MSTKQLEKMRFSTKEDLEKFARANLMTLRDHFGINVWVATDGRYYVTATGKKSLFSFLCVK